MQTSDPTNVTPETEMARRRRANELAELAVAKMKLAVDAADGANTQVTASFTEAIADLSMSPREFAELVSERATPTQGGDRMLQRIEQELVAQISSKVRGAIRDATGVEPILHAPEFHTMEPDGSNTTGALAAMNDQLADTLKVGTEMRSDKEMRALITRMLAEAPAMEGAANQTPAIDGVQLRLKSGKELGMGALSTTPEGTLRFLAASQTKDGVVMVEVLFGYSAVEAIARVVAQAKVPEPSRIVRSS